MTQVNPFSPSENGTIFVIDTATNNVITEVPVGIYPMGIAITPDGKKVYVVNYHSNNVSAFDTETNTVTETVNVGNGPWGVSVTPDGKKIYVSNYFDDTVSVIDATTNTVTDTVSVGDQPQSIAFKQSGSKAYVANSGSNTISVIDTSTNAVTAAITVNQSVWNIAVASVSLIRAEGDIDVYLIGKGEKHRFTSPEALLWNGYSFDDVKSVTSETLQNYPNGDDISISQPIIDKYNALGGAPIFGASDGKGESTGDSDNAGTYCSYVNFENGSIECFKNGPHNGEAYAVFKPLYTKWASLGYGKSVLGYPIGNMSDPQTSKFGTQFRYQNFTNGTENGALEYNISSGIVYEIHGAIFAKWRALDYAKSNLGLVTSNERDALQSFNGTTGRVSDFENGHLHWHSNGTHYMITYMTYGDLDKFYVNMGGTASNLGFPIMDQEERNGHGYCEFEGGKITWDNSTGAYKAIASPTVSPDKPVRTIQGRVVYPELVGYEFTNYLPLKYAKIVIDVDNDPNNGILASSNTASDGSFKVEINDKTESESLYMRIYADTEGSEKDKVSVSLDGESVVYYPITIAKSSNTYDIVIPSSFSAFQIYGHILTAHDFFSNYLGMNKIKIALNNTLPTSSYNKGVIYVNPIRYTLQKGRIQELYHEYGHFVMDSSHGLLSNIPYSVYSSIYGSQTSVFDYMIYNAKNSEWGWIEGWAIFTMAATNGSEKIIVGDQDPDNVDVTIDLENANSPYNVVPWPRYAPQSSRNAVRNAAFLWDIYDGKGGWDLTETFDQFDGGNNLKDILDIICGNKIYYTPYGNGEIYEHKTPLNIKEFYEGWVSSAKPHVPELNELIKHHFKEYKEIQAYSPVTLHLYDSSGNHIGVNNTTGGIDRGISGSYYSGPDSHPQVIFIVGCNESDQDTLVINGTENGNFTLVFENAANGTVVNTTYENVSVKNGSLGYLGTNIEDEQHLLEMDFNGDGVLDESISPTHIEIHVGNGSSSIGNLQFTNNTTWIKWTWTNPIDSYFSYTEIYLNGTLQNNTNAEYFIATGLQPETNYTLSTRTVDIFGKVNETWVNSTVTTGKESVPAIKIIKSVIDPDPNGDCILNNPGDKVPYRIVVKNEGNVTLTNVTVHDSLIPLLTGPTGDNNYDGILSPEETWVYNGTYSLTQSDVDKGYIINNATVMCDQLPSKSTNLVTPILNNQGLQVYKSVAGLDVAGNNVIDRSGDVINYQVAIQNTGNTNLTGISVSDPMITLTKSGDTALNSLVLRPGEAWVYKGDYTITQSDIANATTGGRAIITNTVTVKCDQLPDENSSIEVQIVPTVNAQADTNNISNNTSENGSNSNPPTASVTQTTSSNDGGSSGGSSGHATVVRSGSSPANNSTTDNMSATANETKPKTNPSNSEQGSTPTTFKTVVQKATSTPAKESKKTPGFEIISGITALLGAIYLYRRR